MAISDSIQKFTSKARDVAGVAAAVADFPGVPEGIRNSIQSLFGSGTGLGAGSNRRDLNNFLGTASKLNGFYRPAHFYVEIAPPLFMRQEGESDNARSIAFLCESASLPGVSLATSDVKRFGYGPIEKKPYAPTFVDTTLSFFVDATGLVQKFFYKWMNGIVRFDNMPLSGYYPAGPSTLMAPFEVNYKEQYRSDILITTVNETNDDIINIRLIDAYPLFMGDVALSWADTDSIARLPITFTYYTWKIENLNISQARTVREESVLQKIIKAGTAIQTLSTIRKPNSVADVINVVNNTKIAIGGLF